MRFIKTDDLNIKYPVLSINGIFDFKKSRDQSTNLFETESGVFSSGIEKILSLTDRDREQRAHVAVSEAPGQLHVAVLPPG